MPGLADFITSLIAPNVVAAAAQTAMLPLTVFFALFAVAVARLPESQRDTLLAFFLALANAMLTLIGWVLWIAPVGVFALGIGVAAQAGGGAFATFLHYIMAVTMMGTVVFLGAYLLAWIGGRIAPHRFARAMVPAQAVGFSTQSSLASLPAMLASARRLGLRDSTADFALPLAVAIFRATSPAMNLAVAIYVAHWLGIEISVQQMAIGVGVAFITTLGSVSLPGTISFIAAIAPICMAMGIPLEPLGLLVAIETFPDIMRTVGNVTMDIAVTGTVARAEGDMK